MIELPTFYIKQHFMLSRPFHGDVAKTAAKANHIDVAVESEIGVMSGVRIAGMELEGKYYAICGTRPIEHFVARYVQEHGHKAKRIMRTLDGKVFRFHMYEAEKTPDIVEVGYQFTNMDMVFQIGTHFRIPHLLMFGELVRYRQEGDAELCSETGSPIFTLDGKLLGVTMGRVADGIFSCTPMECMVSDFWQNARN